MVKKEKHILIDNEWLGNVRIEVIKQDPLKIEDFTGRKRKTREAKASKKTKKSIEWNLHEKKPHKHKH